MLLSWCLQLATLLLNVNDTEIKFIIIVIIIIIFRIVLIVKFDLSFYRPFLAIKCRGGTISFPAWEA